jgi:hypothetical protein
MKQDAENLTYTKFFIFHPLNTGKGKVTKTKRRKEGSVPLQQKTQQIIKIFKSNLEQERN